MKRSGVGLPCPSDSTTGRVDEQESSPLTRSDPPANRSSGEVGSLATDLYLLGWEPPAPGRAHPITVDFLDESRDRLDEVEDISPWFLERNRIIDTLLGGCFCPDSLVDVGAGNGSVSAHLKQRGIDVIAVEPGAAGVANCQRRGLLTFEASLETLKFPPDSLPAIGMFDVLEHLDEPERMVREASRTLMLDGLLIVTVPAFPILWSQYDEIAGHHRRYTVTTLDSLITKQGFRRVFGSYFFSLGAPFAAIQRVIPYRLGRRKTEEAMINETQQLAPKGSTIPRLLRLAGAAECKLLSKGRRLPFGSSIGAIYRKDSTIDSGASLFRR